jgi:hypothetical protein
MIMVTHPFEVGHAGRSRFASLVANGRSRLGQSFSQRTLPDRIDQKAKSHDHRDSRHTSEGLYEHAGDEKQWVLQESEPPFYGLAALVLGEQLVVG